MIPETERAYLAGLIDGEGTIAIYKRDPRHGWTLRLYMSNTDRAMLEWIAARFGGGIRVAWRSQHDRRPNERICYVWQLGGRNALPVLLAAQPYLRTKREHCDLAIEFARTQANVGRRGMAPEILARRLEIVDRIKKINARGRLRAA